jgi:hypothetical protein
MAGLDTELCNELKYKKHSNTNICRRGKKVLRRRRDVVVSSLKYYLRGSGFDTENIHLTTV